MAETLSPSPVSSQAPHLVTGEQLALPEGAGHVMDGEAQVVVAVLEVQHPGGSDQLPPQLLLQLDHLLPAQQQSGSSRCCTLRAHPLL